MGSVKNNVVSKFKNKKQCIRVAEKKSGCQRVHQWGQGRDEGVCVQLVVVLSKKKEMGMNLSATLVLLSVVHFLQGLFTSDTLDNIHKYRR